MSHAETGRRERESCSQDHISTRRKRGRVNIICTASRRPAPLFVLSTPRLSRLLLFFFIFTLSSSSPSLFTFHPSTLCLQLWLLAPSCTTSFSRPGIQSTMFPPSIRKSTGSLEVERGRKFASNLLHPFSNFRD